MTSLMIPPADCGGVYCDGPLQRWHLKEFVCSVFIYHTKQTGTKIQWDEIHRGTLLSTPKLQGREVIWSHHGIAPFLHDIILSEYSTIYLIIPVSQLVQGQLDKTSRKTSVSIVEKSSKMPSLIQDRRTELKLLYHSVIQATFRILTRFNHHAQEQLMHQQTSKSA